MGAVCAVVYLMCMIVFMPFPFYEYFVVTTSGGGNRDAVEEVETGRLLHRFPHNKVISYVSIEWNLAIDESEISPSWANTSRQFFHSKAW